MILEEFNPAIAYIIKKMMKVNLNLQKGEKFLIATDYPSPLDLKFRERHVLQRIIKRNFLAKYIHNLALEYHPQTQTELLAYSCPWKHYPEIDKSFIKKILSYDVVYLLSEFSVTNIIWKINSSSKIKTRLAFSPMGDETMFYPGGPLDIDDNKLENEVMQVYAKLKRGKKCRLYTHLGTDIEFKLENIVLRYESGIVDVPKKGANLPAGEVTISRALINGTYIVPAGWIEGLYSNLEVKIENGYVVSVKQNEEKESWVKKYFPSNPIKYRINHLSIGFNENATNPFIPLELGKMRGMTNFSIRIDEKTKDPTSTSIWPGNFPSPNTYLEIDEELVFKNGRLLI